MNESLKLPGPFEIYKIVEFEGAFREPTHIIPLATEEAFQTTKSYNDSRFYDKIKNKLIMSFHGLLVKTRKSIILVDTCIGNNKNRPNIPEWHMRDGSFIDKINNTGIRVSDINFILCTHLHADHVGWNTKLINGRWVPTFPNAKYLFCKEEFSFWEKDRNANHGSWEDSIQPIIDSGQVEIVEPNHIIEPGVELLPAFGHSPGHIIVKLSDGIAEAYLIGDVIHHPVQIEHPEWSSNFCWDEFKATKMRKFIIQETCNKNKYIIPAHFPSPSAFQLRRLEKGVWLK